MNYPIFVTDENIPLVNHHDKDRNDERNDHHDDHYDNYNTQNTSGVEKTTLTIPSSTVKETTSTLQLRQKAK